MGWFEKQIKQRSDLDQQLFEESFFRVAGVVLGERTATKISDEHIITKQAIDDILKYYHFKPVEIPKTIKEHEEQLNYCLRPHGLMKRKIECCFPRTISEKKPLIWWTPLQNISKKPMSIWKTIPNRILLTQHAATVPFSMRGVHCFTPTF